MGTLEIVLISLGVSAVALVLLYVLSAKKKKGKAEAPSTGSEAKVEPVYKKPEADKPKDEPSVETLKVIRKQSEIKINKKALKGDSRNPSITKVFVNGKNVEEEPEAVAEEPVAEEKPTIGAFGTREPEFSQPLDGKPRERSPFQMPNRAPIIGDRTNFTSRLHVSEDNNLSGVSGTGIAKALSESENKMSDIDQKTEDMVDEIRRTFLGQTSPLLTNDESLSSTKNTKINVKDFDAKTLIIADILNHPRGQKRA